MEPTNIRFGGGASGTVLHPLVALALLIAAAGILFLPRRRALGFLVSTALLVAFGQVVVIAGVHFTVYRILILVALLRLAISPAPGGKRFAGGWNGIDRAFMIWAL